VPVAALKRLAKLRQLDLRGNNISHVPEDMFIGFGQTLKMLSLQKNSISTLPNKIFEELHLLEWLHLNENQMTQLPKDTFEQLFTNLKVLDVHGNPFVCDCNMLWFKEWVQKDRGKVLTYSDQTHCAEPFEHTHKPIAKVPSSAMTCPLMTQQPPTPTSSTSTTNFASIIILSTAVSKILILT
jgi:Leucine-rich repeat (LRR) protein